VLRAGEREQVQKTFASQLHLNLRVLDGTKQFLAGLKTGNMEVLNTRSGDWEIEPARQTTAGWLQKYANVDAVMAANDNMALGAAQAIAEANARIFLSPALTPPMLRCKPSQPDNISSDDSESITIILGKSFIPFCITHL
jgi:hypothetical protein